MKNKNKLDKLETLQYRARDLSGWASVKRWGLDSHQRQVNALKSLASRWGYKVWDDGDKLWIVQNKF